MTVRALACLLGMLLAFPSYLHADPGTAKGPEGKVESAPAQVKLLDLPLLDQDGKTVRFRTDVIGDRIVVLDTFFTTCGLICPILGAIMMELQEKVGDRLGRDVTLVSISVDPATDIPPRLKQYATQWDARPGWVFLTGGKPDVDRVLTGLGLYTADFTSHPSAFLVGDGKSGEWTRFYGFATPEQLMEKITALSGKRKGGSGRY